MYIVYERAYVTASHIYVPEYEYLILKNTKTQIGKTRILKIMCEGEKKRKKYEHKREREISSKVAFF